MRRLVSSMIIILIILSTLITYAHISPLVEADIETIHESSLDSQQTSQYLKFNSDRTSLMNYDFNQESLRKTAYTRGEFTRLVIHTKDHSDTYFEKIKHLITGNNGKIVDTISLKDKIIAIVVEVKLDEASHLAQVIQDSKLANYVEPEIVYEASVVPNDPNWTIQWGPEKIEADWAWNYTTGNTDVLVAVIDSGIDYNHLDLSDNYVSYGYDWVNNDNDTMDDNGHGTHCAGIIAAKLNNAIGIAGLAQVKIMAEKVLNALGQGTTSQVYNGIINATDAGADIISMSLGGGYSGLVKTAVEYAFDNGVILIAAAGNSATIFKGYPAGHEEVIAVAATDQSDELTEWSCQGGSNFGSWVEIAAPGEDIYSTWLNNGYQYADGTSMAAPHVSGVAALVLSRYPHLTRDSVRYWLRHTADDIGLQGLDVYTGYGRVNAQNAVKSSQYDYDLVAIDLDLPPSVDANVTRNVEGIVLNLGTQNQSNIDVHLLENGTSISNKTISYISSGNSSIIDFNWTPTSGFYNITLSIISDNENYTSNNYKSANVTARFASTLNVPLDYSTIKGALHEAVSGDLINVSSGTFNEVLFVDKDNIELRGVSKQLTTVKGRGQAPVISIRAENTTITKLTIKGTITVCGTGLGPYPFGSIVNVDIRSQKGTNISLSSLEDAFWGIGVFSSTDIKIKSSNIENHEEGGIVLSNSNNTELTAINITKCERDSDDPIFYKYGLYILNCYDTNVTECDVTQNQYGIIQESSHNSVYDHNDVSDNQLEGFFLYEGSNNILKYNKFHDNGGDPESSFPAGPLLYGLWICYSSNNTLKNNVILNCSDNFLITGVILEHFIHDIDTTNSIEKKSIRYLVNKQNEEVTAQSGFVALVNCSNVNVTNLNILTHSYQVILLAYTVNSSITENTINTGVFGIRIINSSGNTLFKNTITSCTFGVDLHDSHNNTLIRNIITNSLFGLFAAHSSNNIIYHNKFSGNTIHADSRTEATNIWDNGYPAGGNYWGSSGTDQYHGPYQNETGSDGIIDNPKIIDEIHEDDVDNYPLKNQWSAPDIAILDVVTSKTIVGEGYTADINVTVENQKSKVEGFNLTVYANSTVITSEYIILTSGNQTNVYTWNTTGWSKGNYSISALVESLPGEVDLSDNEFDDGWIFESIPGDVDGDRDVDIYDMVLIGGAYGSEKGQPNYDPNCDIDSDGDVDIYDMTIASGHYGESW